MVKIIKKIYWKVFDFFYCVFRKREVVLFLLLLNLIITILIWQKLNKITK